MSHLMALMGGSLPLPGLGSVPGPHRGGAAATAPGVEKTHRFEVKLDPTQVSVINFRELQVCGRGGGEGVARFLLRCR